MSSPHSSAPTSAQINGGSSSAAMDDTTSDTSDAGSASSTNDEGYDFFEQNQRSVLFHPVGLPLVAAFHGSVLHNLPAEYPVEAFPPEIGTNENGNTILSEVYHSLPKDSTERIMNEPKLIQGLRDEIERAFADQFRVETETRVLFDGRNYGECMDLALFPKRNEEGQASAADTPLCVVQVGLSSDDWWTKFYQGCSDLHLMQQKPDERWCFRKPLLLAIITLNGDTMMMGDAANADVDFCMGVFLCTPTNEASDFRMSLLWHKWHPALEDASNSLGLLLRILNHFQTQRSKEYSKEVYEYFSSTCVKAGNKVLRIYDARFLPSKQGADFYLDPKCKGIVGGDVQKVLEIPEPDGAPEGNAASQEDDPRWRKTFFDESPSKKMLVLATPFREGQHVAQHPSDFLPIIEHLERIHAAGFVHGDIRACNTVFPKEEGGPGYLIDFGVSGIAGEVHYPAGYVTCLSDGRRAGFGKEMIEKWHDWYALGRLIFDIHDFYPQPEGQFTRDHYMHCRNWIHVETDPSADDLLELKSHLSELQQIGWTVVASLGFQQWLDRRNGYQ